MNKDVHLRYAVPGWCFGPTAKPFCEASEPAGLQIRAAFLFDPFLWLRKEKGHALLYESLFRKILLPKSGRFLQCLVNIVFELNGRFLRK